MIYIVFMVLYGVFLLKNHMPLNPQKRVLIGIVIPGIISLVYMSYLCIKSEKKMFIAGQWKFVTIAGTIMMLFSHAITIFMPENAINFPALYAAVGGLIVTALVVLIGNVVNMAASLWRNTKKKTQA